MPELLWRACSSVWTYEGNGQWSGRWQTRGRALAQAERWCATREGVWLESTDGRVEAIQGDPVEAAR